MAKSMVDFDSIVPVDFPRIPEEVRTNDEARQAIVKASAYVTFSLEEAGIEHNRDLSAAFVTDATYTLKEDRTPDEYLELAIQELALAESEVESDDFAQSIGEFRRKLEKART